MLAIVAVAVVCLTNSAGAKAGRSQFYTIRPELFPYMELTYPEYQKLVGEEMEFYHGGLFIGPLPDTEAELILQGEYDEETAGFSLEEHARFIRLQGKFSDLFVLPEEDLGKELSLEELLEHLAEQSGAPLSVEYLEGAGTAYYVANYYVRVGLDCDRDGNLDTSLDIAAGWEDWVESVNSDTTVWMTRILQESP